jgi:TAT (twin-arginine translocation) pathway signal sequence./Nitroreductase family.
MAMMSRRSFLKGAAAAAALISVGGVTHAVKQGAFSTGSGPAYEPWQTWKNVKEGEKPLLRVVRASVLAANAHNTQPWLYRVEDRTIDVFADISRNIGTIDPWFREMYISLGCAVENAELAARAYGYRADITLYPGGLERIHVARIVLEEGPEEPSDLYRAIGDRHTNRAAYDSAKQVEASVLREMEKLANSLGDVRLVWFADETGRKEMGNLIVGATEAVANDAIQSADSHRWFRNDWGEIQRHKDGPTMDATGNSAFTRFIGKLFPVSEQTSNEYWLKATKNTYVATAPVFGTIAIKDQTDRVQLMQAGRLWQRMHLWAVAKGLAAHPLNQPHERRDRELQLSIEPAFGRELARLVNMPGYEGVFTFRLGYPTSPALPSPRRSAEEVVLGASKPTPKD